MVTLKDWTAVIRSFSQHNRTGWDYANNTTFTWDDGHVLVLLHGNQIATIFEKGIRLYSAGFKTATTKRRLNQVLETLTIPASVFQKGGKWYVQTPSGVAPFEDGIYVTWWGYAPEEGSRVK